MNKRVITVGIISIVLISLSVFQLMKNKNKIAKEIYIHDTSTPILVEDGRAEVHTFDSQFSFLGTFEPNRINLIGSEGQGKINIESQINDNNFTLILTDEGIGISEDEKKNIFKKFYRVGEEKTRTTPGSGLGLFLVKKITEIHGGKVTVENNLPKGSKFILAFSAKDSLLG